MKIAHHTVVALDYVLTDNRGTILDQSQQGEFTYLHGAHNIIPGLEKALTGKQTGDQFAVVIAPADGYGERDTDLTQTVPMDMFDSPEQVVVGQKFHAQSGQGDPIVVTVLEVQNGQVTIDGNHPLAGLDLHFAVTVVNVREASQEEIAHGHVHTPGHHHH
ncbi:MAG: peptidylprolyl isomerase [Gammaproteobacteria bacterium]|nr:peptidylprolyl isomerase [Gammaproteobacteria bacterium]